MPDISVIVPVYNVERYVERCLRSLFTQTKTEGVEFVLINDCTPDGSMAIVQRVVAEFAHLDVKILENEKNCGTSVTRYRAIQAAQGEYSIQIDSDDWVEPTMLEELWAERVRTGADIVACDYIEEHKRKSKRFRFGRLAQSGRGCLSAVLSAGMLGSLCFKMTRTALYAEAGVKPIEGLSMCEDLLFSTRLYCAANGVAQLHKAYYHYDRTNESSITAQFTARACDDLLRVEVEIERALAEFGAMTPALEERLLIRKFEVCRKLFIYSPNDRLAAIAGLYPEILPHIWGVKGVRFKQRLALWAASKGCLWVAKLLFFTSRRKVRR